MEAIVIVGRLQWLVFIIEVGGPSFFYTLSVVLVILLHHKGHGTNYHSALSHKLTVVAGLLLLLEDGQQLRDAITE
mgnify:FL=1